MDSRQTPLASALVEQIGAGLIVLDRDLRSPYRNAAIGRCSDKAQAHNQPPPTDAARDRDRRFRPCLPAKQPAVAVESGGQAR